MWFFFSRAGTLIRFIGEMQRRITKFLNVNDFYLAMKTVESALFRDNKFSDSIMDNSFVSEPEYICAKSLLRIFKE